VSFLVGVVALALVTALACAVPGVFLLLRKDAMMTEAVSHAVLPGIVIGLLFVGALDSPFLILAAALTGLLVVLGTEYLRSTGLVEGDAPLGLLFPALFSIGIILVSQRFANVHLDEHVVLVGDLNLAAFIHLEVGDVSLGPRYLYVMLAVLLLNIAFVTRFFKELQVTTFDPDFAQLSGFSVRRLHYTFMFLVSITITAAFYAAGSILTVALMIVPAATAHLVTKRLPRCWRSRRPSPWSERWRASAPPTRSTPPPRARWPSSSASASWSCSSAHGCGRPFGPRERSPCDASTVGATVPDRSVPPLRCACAEAPLRSGTPPCTGVREVRSRCRSVACRPV
jgi:manganese/zinc/iron transport system permease protein